MLAFWALLKIAFKNTFTYRTSVLVGFSGSILVILAQIAIWTYIF
jgi:hypothetical protein